MATNNENKQLVALMFAPWVNKLEYKELWIFTLFKDTILFVAKVSIWIPIIAFFITTLFLIILFLPILTPLPITQFWPIKQDLSISEYLFTNCFKTLKMS